MDFNKNDVVKKDLKMDFNKKKEGRFSYKFNLVSWIINIQREYSRKRINIVISLHYKGNYINIDLANQLLILEPSIICNGQYNIKDLQVTIDDYKYISQYNVTTMYKKKLT
jgi:hypothetical protein